MYLSWSKHHWSVTNPHGMARREAGWNISSKLISRSLWQSLIGREQKIGAVESPGIWVDLAEGESTNEKQMTRRTRRWKRIWWMRRRMLIESSLIWVWLQNPRWSHSRLWYWDGIFINQGHINKVYRHQWQTAKHIDQTPGIHGCDKTLDNMWKMLENIGRKKSPGIWVDLVEPYHHAG